MASEPDTDGKKRKEIGADLIIPALAVAFTLYYFSTIWNLSWEATANAYSIGGILLILITALLVRSALQVKRSGATFGMERFLAAQGSQGRRLGLIAAIIAFISALPILGLTLGIFLFMVATMLILGARKPLPLLVAALTVSIVGYVGFIIVLNTRFPHGPIENLLARLW